MRSALSMCRAPASGRAETDSGITVFSNIPSGDSGPTTDLGSIALTYPEVGVEGSLSGNTITGEDTDTILDFNIDLDGFLGLVSNFALPGSGVVISALTGLAFELGDIVEISYDVIDVEAGPTVSLLQNFTVTPTLNVGLDFSQAVEINGVSTTSWSGAWSDFPEFSIQDTTIVTPTFTVGATLNSRSALAFGLELTVDALKAEFAVANPITGGTLLNSSLGPVWELDPPLAEPNFSSLRIYENTFDLGGFSPIVGDRLVFTTPDSGVNGGIDSSVNDAPDAADDTVMAMVQPVVIDVLANDFDFEGDPLSVSSVIPGANGAVEINPDNAITYTPNVGFIGTDTFTYTISDGELTDTATVTVNVVEQFALAVETLVDANNDGVFADSENGISGGNATFQITVMNPGNVDFTIDSISSNLSNLGNSSLAALVGTFVGASDAVTGTLEMTLLTLEMEATVGADGADTLNGQQTIQTNEIIVTVLNANGETETLSTTATVVVDANDIIAGGLGDDLIFGLGGDDILRGDLNLRDPQDDAPGGNDTIFGGAGDDRIGGKSGNDELFGGAGNDTIWGDDGDDLIFGGLGDDVLIGDNDSAGAGSDTFVLVAGEGTDRIVDFEVGIDFIGLTGLTFGSLSFTTLGKDTLISAGTENLAIVQGVAAADLTENVFVLT